ncbi:MAG: hypothetical protein MJ252_13490 [archaeon]|nr:hypothetical protein [archaeon]
MDKSKNSLPKINEENKRKVKKLSKAKINNKHLIKIITERFFKGYTKIEYLKKYRMLNRPERKISVLTEWEYDNPLFFKDEFRYTYRDKFLSKLEGPKFNNVFNIINYNKANKVKEDNDYQAKSDLFITMQINNTINKEKEKYESMDIPVLPIKDNIWIESTNSYNNTLDKEQFKTNIKNSRNKEDNKEQLSKDKKENSLSKDKISKREIKMMTDSECEIGYPLLKEKQYHNAISKGKKLKILQPYYNQLNNHQMSALVNFEEDFAKTNYMKKSLHQKKALCDIKKLALVNKEDFIRTYQREGEMENFNEMNYFKSPRGFNFTHTYNNYPKSRALKFNTLSCQSNMSKNTKTENEDKSNLLTIKPAKNNFLFKSYNKFKDVGNNSPKDIISLKEYSKTINVDK